MLYHQFIAISMVEIAWKTIKIEVFPRFSRQTRLWPLGNQQGRCWKGRQWSQFCRCTNLNVFKWREGHQPKWGDRMLGGTSKRVMQPANKALPLAGVIVLHVQNHRHLLNGMDWSIDLVMCQGKYQQNGWSYHEMTKIGGLENLAFARNAHFVPFTAGTNNNGCWPLATQFQLSAFFHPFP